MKKLSRRDLAAAGLPLLTGLFHLGCGRREDAATKSSLEYSIDHLRHVDPALLTWNEVGRVEVSGETLRGIAGSPDGRVFVTADREMIELDDRGEVGRFDLAAPAKCVDIDADQTVFVGFESHVEVWDREGRRIDTWQPIADEAVITSIAAAEDEILVADAGSKRVLRFDRLGKPLGVIGGQGEGDEGPVFIVPSPFFDLAVAPDGFVWVTNPGRQSVQNFAPDGSLRSSWGEAGMNVEGFCGCCNPTHLDVLPDGRFVTSEKGLPRIKVYAPTGQLQAVVAGPDQFSDGVVGLDLAVDAEGRIRVLDPSIKAVRIFEEKTA